ncbi:histidine kinase dimerization/phospho-acceptor domain-containing protein [Melghirimyces algeriensis]|uniref:histidine kinase n=1 Tax=Melghirimyces algeriensis TaxID=910412 RepID=A0A521FBE8_9BACL|nr:PAS domain-containing sensor histidine kinase [Melghirimyces algeriensis]SMO93473.1 PAS domain-containing protein [Melghirimyces algeriensis]
MKYNGDKRDRKLSIAFDLNMHPGEQMSWVEKMPQLAVAVDERGIVEAVSRSLLEKLRMDKEQVIGNSLDRFLMLPQEISELNQPMEVHETPLCSIKGMLFPVGSSPMVADIQLLSGKTPRGWRHLLLTIPEEEHSNLLTKYADRIFHELTQGVILLRHSKVMEINPEACRMFRVKKDEVIGKVVDCLFVHPGEDEGLNDIRNRILRGEPFHGLSACWVDQNRSLAIHMDHKIIGKKPNDGTPSDTLLITTDVTQSYLLDMQVRQTDRLAMIGQIAAGTAHEIRNPLTSIRGFLQVMRHSSDEKKDLKGQGYTEIMLREIDRINNLVGEFLMMSKQTPQSEKISSKDGSGHPRAFADY